MSEYKNNAPVHIAMIMDGNGRWAKQRSINKKTLRWSRDYY